VCYTIQLYSRYHFAQRPCYYFVNLSPRWGEISDFAVCGDILYILFSGKEVLDCYSLDGTYLHSYSIKLGDKGRATLYVNNDMLYLKSKDFTFYTFLDGLFVKSYDVSVTELYSEIKKLSESKSQVDEVKYERRGASIWKEMNGIRTEVVHRPSWMVIFQGSLLLLVGPISFIALCFFLYYYKNKCA